MPAPCVSTTCWAGASLLSSQVSCLLPRDPLPLGPGSTFMHVSQTHSSGPKNSFPLYLDNLVSGVKGLDFSLERGVDRWSFTWFCEL